MSTVFFTIAHHIMTGTGGIILAVHHFAGSFMHIMTGTGGIIL
jgi:hypothetical protein